jgi:hypothetical protein
MTERATNSLPIVWHILLAAMLVAGAVLASVELPAPEALDRVTDRIQGEIWWRIIGVLMAAIAVMHWVVFGVLRALRSLFDLPGATDNARVSLWPPALLGALEAVMYPLALLASHADFIGLWLLLKVAGQWPGWGLRENGCQAELDRGRRRYYHFLIGNGLMVLAGVVTFAVLKMIGVE